ncbi:DUF2235 domain-containing protein [Pseudoduganella sp. OTU4001]|uniref:DUF2235 domain-containing protein n=1 Tax=Pseudoduganella sp. OTU4001 TaxID=3043854 RepID=UPI00313F317D
MGKFIVFCADGTWNAPTQDEDDDGDFDPTNVYKLFANLAGTLDPHTTCLAREQESSHRAASGELLQVAKYIHGVGDSRNKIRQIIGGATGAGLISRIVRGYTFISRNYEQGDKIVVSGFSRGAYTARALAGMIAHQGLLRKELTTDREQAYRKGAQAWFRYRDDVMPRNARGMLANFSEIISDLPAFLSKRSLDDDDFVAVPEIAAVAVWDTVGAMGVPCFLGPKSDAFAFVNNKLSSKVVHGLHAIAIDEQRIDFIPTLWDKADNATQMLFPGAHSDVGGGYPECGLSDGALEWMVAELKDRLGLHFHATPPFCLNPDHSAAAHQPWESPPWNFGGHRTKTRKFAPTAGLLIHPSVHSRIELGSYDPPSLAALLK